MHSAAPTAMLGTKWTQRFGAIRANQCTLVAICGATASRPIVALEQIVCTLKRHAAFFTILPNAAARRLWRFTHTFLRLFFFNVLLFFLKKNNSMPTVRSSTRPATRQATRKSKTPEASKKVAKKPALKEKASVVVPAHRVVLSSADKSEKSNPPTALLCNWRNCTMAADGGVADALRLCPFCHRVGYCCVYCMEQDIYGHVSHECAQNVKKARVVKA